MTKQKPFFRASVRDDGTLELLVYEGIGKDFDGTGVTASDIKRQIDQSAGYGKIVLRINSPGGDCFEGIAICNLLRSLGKPIEVCIDGVAASAASIVAMCGDTITMASNALQMIHNAWTVQVGDAADMRKMADTLDKVSTSIAQTYVDRTGQSLEKVKAMMDAETWLSASEAVELGFATNVATEPEADEDATNALALARTFTKLKNMKNVPAQLIRAENVNGCMCDCQNCIDNDCGNCTVEGCEDMHCENCPMQNETVTDSDVSLYEARLRLATLRK